MECGLNLWDTAAVYGEGTSQTGIVIPAILTAVYAFLMIRFEDIKRIMAVYYEQNVTSEKFEDFDGERWIIPDD